MENEKRMRREIANSNERRRMQSINAGFQTLRDLLPQHEGEKLSKAAILQQTSDFIYSLEQEKTRLLTQNCQLKRLMGQQQAAADSCDSAVDSPLSAGGGPRRCSTSREAGDEVLDPAAPGHSAALLELQRELDELRAQLEREEQLRAVMQEQLRAAQHQLFQQEEETFVAPVVSSKRARVEEEVEARVALPVVLPVVEVPRLPHQRDMFASAEPTTCVVNVIDKEHRGSLYGSATTTSRQNLDTIVEAIRHLEGDHLFCDTEESAPPPSSSADVADELQDMPLALTTHDRGMYPAPAIYYPPPPHHGLLES